MAAKDQDVYERLRTALLHLDVVPGEGLSERGLESMLGASRTPIRAALLRLEGEGLTQRSGRGWRAAPIDLTEIRAVMEFREAIEHAAIGHVVERAEQSDLEALRLLAQRGSELPDQETVLREGGELHTALVGLSGNPFLLEAMRDVLTRLARTRWLEARTAESRAHATAEHREIVEAVLARDADSARALALAHTRGTRDRLLGLLEQEHRRLRGRGVAIIDSAPA